MWRPEALVLNWGLGTLTHYGPDCITPPPAGSARAVPTDCS